MRKLIGCLVLIAGLGGLGYVATISHAGRIQSMIAVQANALANATRNDVRVRVAGRDVILSGVVTDQQDRAALAAKFRTIPGVRAVDVSRIGVLPRAIPFAVTIERPIIGPITLSGAVPSAAARDALVAAAAHAEADLTVATGVPDAAWASVAERAVTAAALLISGEVILSDRDIRMAGLARNPDGAAAALDALDGLPDGYTLSSDIDVEDDGTPLRLMLTLLDDNVSGGGKFPADLHQAEVTDRFLAGEIAIQQADLAPADPDWPTATRTAMDALALLEDGVLAITARDISLNGRGTPDGIAQAAQLLAGLPEGFAVTTDLTLWDDGAPFAMTLLWDGTAATAEGKFPVGFTPRGPGDIAATSTARHSGLADETGDFTTNAAAGTAALGMMNTGTLQVTAQDITLIGTAASPQVGVAMDAALADAATGTTIRRDLIYLDDGSPAAFTLRYNAATGAQIEGRLPVGLGIDDLSQSLGAPEISGRAGTAFDDDDVGSTVDALQIVATYLPEIETMTFAREGGAGMLELVLSPGVDLDLVANDLAERLPLDLAFALSPLDDLPEPGTTRTNAASGLMEVFADGFWLPDFDVATDPDGCTAQTTAVLDRNLIGFLPGSARLDAVSMRTINALAAVVLPCVAADMSLEIGGHTDATGDALDNLDLSRARAGAVQDALIARGVPARAITAYGFGQSQPIADNETPEGRAANRRTDLTWYAPGALRDP